MMKNMPKIDQPRERFDRLGASSLSDYEILAIILGNGYKNKSVLDLAQEILRKFTNIQDFLQITTKELEGVKGLGHVKALRIMASIEFAKRVNRSVSKESVRISSDVYDLMIGEMKGKKQETFYVITLDSKCHVISKRLLFVGSQTRTITHPREIFKIAVKDSAVGIIICHNHPSGIPNPSMADLEFTKKIYRLGIEMEIELYDHVIISDDAYYSLKEHNDY